MGKELGRSILIYLISLNIIGLTAPIYLRIMRQVKLPDRKFLRCRFSEDSVY